MRAHTSSSPPLQARTKSLQDWAPIGFLPIPALIVLVALVYFGVEPSWSYDPAWLILIGNTLFVTLAYFVGSYLALMNFNATGRIQILLLGCGVLTVGLGGVLAALVRGIPGDGANLNVTIYNVGALAGASFHFVAAFILLAGISLELDAKRKKWWLALGYLGSVFFMAALTLASLKGVIPLFFIQGVGPTPLRQWVLGTADVFFVFSFLVFIGTYLRSRESFLYWYSCALALIAINLTAGLMESSVGSAVGWVGRFSLYLSGVYFLVSIVTAVRSAQSRRSSLDNILITALSGVEEKFRALAEHTPDVIRRFDRDLRHIYVNPAGLRLLGKPAGAVIGKPLDEIGLPENQCRVWEERILKVFQTGAPMEVEDELPTESGTGFFESHCVPEYGADGRVGNVLVVSRNLTARKRAVEAVRESEARYRLLFHGMLNGFAYCLMLFDDRRPIDFVYLNVNDSFGRLTGLKDVVGKRVTEVIPGIRESNPEVFEIYGKVASTGQPESFETYIEGLDIWFSIAVYSPRKDHFVAVFDNISARKRAEEVLKRSRQGLSRLAEASVRVMRETDHETMLRAISAAALELTGARIATCGHGYINGQLRIGGAARAPGMPECPADKAFSVEKGGVYLELVEGSADTMRLTDEQLRAHPRWRGLPEGHVPMRGLLGVRLVDRERRANGMLLVTNKEQGEFTEEDESLLRQLGTFASLASQHVQARISLEEADRHKDEFLAMLSHELRNPLAPMSTGLSILERVTPGSEQAQQAQAVIARQVAHLTRLVDDLLDVTRVSRGKIQLQRESLDFTEVVRRAVEDHRALFETNGLELQVSIPDKPIRINADRTRVVQVIGNLLGNAAKFTPPGGKVSVSVQDHDPLGQAVARVRDTGAGIAPEMLPRIFEPFMQAHATLDRGKGGLGLGLSVVKGIVEMHGGTASAASEGLGKGAEFAVRFPLETQGGSGLYPGESEPAPTRRR